MEAKDGGNDDEDYLKKRSAKLDQIMHQVQRVESEINEYEHIMKT